jgi:hypothetical protein
MIRNYRMLLVCGFCLLWLAATPARALGPNQLANGSFEEPSGTPGTPYGWSRAAFAPGASLTWESDVAHDGMSSIRISNPAPNDAAWTQTVTLEPDHNAPHRLEPRHRQAEGI